MLISFCHAASKSAKSVGVQGLRCENRVNPLGIDKQRPRFSWLLTGTDRGLMQQAYELRVGTDSARLTAGKGLVWASGKIETDQSVYVLYGGAQLRTSTKYFWQVRVYDNFGRRSAWSEVAHWSMGLLSPDDWKAKWISRGADQREPEVTVPIFRHEFKRAKKLKSATAYITSLGLYEAFINGERVGDAYFTPGWTSYTKRLQYQAYDVTSLIKAGDNAIGVRLGYGWYKSPLGWGVKFNEEIKDRNLALLFQLELVYTDGSVETIGSDERWKQGVGAIQRSEIYAGEFIDGRKEPEGWLYAGFDDSAWNPVNIEPDGKPRLVASESEPVRRREALAPCGISLTAEGDWLVDFGQNIAGYVEITATGQPGDSIVVEHAEILDQRGEFYTENLRTAQSTNTYVLAGKGKEKFFPHFTFQGFRYIRVKGLRWEPTASDFKAFALYTDMAETGSFSCSHPLINQLQKNIAWGQKGNFLDVPTDCPQRDERLGWTGDAQVFAATASFNMNVHNFFAKWLKDLALDQFENGIVPYVIPHVLDDSVSSGSAGWADAATIIPWQMYQAYGDRQLLAEQYHSMKAWVEYMRRESVNDLWKPRKRQIGDWLSYIPASFLDVSKSAHTDMHLIAQCFFAHSTSLVVKAAQVLGRDEDVIIYTALLERIRKAFSDEYVTPNGSLVSNTQTAYLLALNFDLLAGYQTANAVKKLVENINDYGRHLTTGFLGTPYLCAVLTRYGHLDLAYELLLKEDYPSWLYPVTLGATTIWERWDGVRPDGSFQNPDMNSFNHYAYGAIGSWMYTTIAGILSDSVQVGYKKSIIKPKPGGGLTFAKASLATYYGQLVSSWRIANGQFHLDVEIPPNTTAAIWLSTTDIGSVAENGKGLLQQSDIKSINIFDGEIVVEVGAGKYSFLVKNGNYAKY